jgi:hypothetical protein
MLDYDAWRDKQQLMRTQGRYVGIGVASCQEKGLFSAFGEDRIDFGTHGADLVGPNGLRKAVAVRAEASLGAVVVDDFVAQRRHPVVPTTWSLRCARLCHAGHHRF